MNIPDNFIIQDYLKKDLPYHPTWGEEVVYYYSPQVTFREIPDEISLTIPSLCYEHCSSDCNSRFCWKENWKDKENILSWEVLKELIEKNNGITCVTIMTSLNFIELNILFNKLKENYPNIKTALYIGYDLKYLCHYKDFAEFNFKNLDYIKVGSYKREWGPLDNPKTNQRFYQINHLVFGDMFVCITYKFIQKSL